MNANTKFLYSKSSASKVSASFMFILSCFSNIWTIHGIRLRLDKICSCFFFFFFESQNCNINVIFCCVISKRKSNCHIMCDIFFYTWRLFHFTLMTWFIRIYYLLALFPAIQSLQIGFRSISFSHSRSFLLWLLWLDRNQIGQPSATNKLTDNHSKCIPCISLVCVYL